MKASFSRYAAWASVELFFVFSIAMAILFAIQSSSIAGALQLSSAQLGLLSGAFFIAYAGGQLVLGTLMGRFSARLILVSTSTLTVLGCFLMAHAQSMPLAMVSRIAMGFGLSSTFVGVLHIISRDHGARFSFMAAISQSLSNVCGAGTALIGAYTTSLDNFRATFQVMGLVFLAITVLMALFIGGSRRSEGDGDASAMPFGKVVKVCLTSGQFWLAMVYYGGLFGVLLAYSNLWNIQFQTTLFAHSLSHASLMNALIPLGVTVGSVLIGIWVNRRGDYVLPARVYVLLGVFCFLIMCLFSMPRTMASAFNFLIGFSIAGSILGLTVVQRFLPSAATSLGTSMVVTFGFLLGGAIQPIVGMAVGTPTDSASAAQFSVYQGGMLWLLGAVAMAAIASFFFQTPTGTEPVTSSDN